MYSVKFETSTSSSLVETALLAPLLPGFNGTAHDMSHPLHFLDYVTKNTSAPPLEDLEDNELFEHSEQEYIFDRLYIRIGFIILYTIVFCFCFFGNLLVILVVTMHWKMRNITKFCLANLAFADLCVGVFCVYQNLSIYLINSWVFGETLCKMYHFINSLSHTSAVLILVVICVERYLAIRHPFRCKQILTINCLRVLIVAVWIISAIYCSPRLYYVRLIPNPRMDGGTDIICAGNRTLYNSKISDSIHFVLLYLLPLLVMSILYTLVGITLWKSGTVTTKIPVSRPRAVSMERISQRSRPSTSVTSSTSSSGGMVQFDDEDSPQSLTPPPLSFPLKTFSSTSSSHCPGSSSLPVKVSSVGCAETTFISGGGESGVRKSKKGKSKRRSPPPSYMITVGNKCYLVGEKETKVLEVMERDLSNETPILPSSSYPAQQFASSSPPLPHRQQLLLNSGLTKFKKFSSGNSYPYIHDPLKRFGSSGSASSGRPAGVTSSSSSTACNLGNKSTNNNTIQSTRIRSFRGARNRRGKKPGESWRDPLKSRKAVTRMLIIIVVSFAVCNFPFHLRKILQNWQPNYDYHGHFSTLFTHMTFLIMYLNSALNPIIYAFMSKTFRSSVADLLTCNWKKPYHNPPSERRFSATRIVSLNIQTTRAYDRGNSIDAQD